MTNPKVVAQNESISKGYSDHIHGFLDKLGVGGPPSLDDISGVAPTPPSDTKLLPHRAVDIPKKVKLVHEGGVKGKSNK